MQSGFNLLIFTGVYAIKMLHSLFRLHVKISSCFSSNVIATFIIFRLYKCSYYIYK